MASMLRPRLRSPDCRPGSLYLNPPLPLIANIAQAITFSAINASPGQSTVTVSATAGSITHRAQVNLVISTPTLDFIPEVVSTSANGDASKTLVGLLVTPGTYPFEILLASAGGPPLGTTVQLSGLVPGTGLDQSQYTFTTNANGGVPGSFNLTVTSSSSWRNGRSAGDLYRLADQS